MYRPNRPKKILNLPHDEVLTEVLRLIVEFRDEAVASGVDPNEIYWLCDEEGETPMVSYEVPLTAEEIQREQDEKTSQEAAWKKQEEAGELATLARLIVKYGIPNLDGSISFTPPIKE